MTGPIILGRTQAKTMGYVKFPKIKQPHAFTMCSTTLKKICTDKTPSPETAGNTKFTHLNGTMPKTVHVHKSKSTKATQAKQYKQTEEPVVPKIKWNKILLSSMAKCTSYCHVLT